MLKWSLLFTFALALLTTAVESAEEGLVIELDDKNFTTILEEPRFREGKVLIEFYAHWCPHCQHYRPEYERIGKFFLSNPRPEPYVWVLRIDCAIPEHYKICSNFKVHGYPTLYLGTVERFISQKVDDLINVPALSFEKMIPHLSTTLKVQYQLPKTTTETAVEVAKPAKKLVRKETSIRLSIDDVERATVEIFEHVLSSEAILQGNKVRVAFVHWINLLQEAHPSIRCRSSIQYLSNHLSDLWPETSPIPDSLLTKFKICGINFQAKEWTSCAGSVPGHRGFTCGVWQLLHALTVGISSQQAQLWAAGVKAFASYFFGCEECSKHFLQTMERHNVEELHEKNELVLWLWEIHNVVNKRLQKEEEEHQNGDPDFPKVQWPTFSLCPACQSTSDSEQPEWKKREVLNFLLVFYTPLRTQEVSSVSRRELARGNLELKAIDVFPSEYASHLEKNTFHFKIYMLVLVVVIVGLTLRSKRTRHNRVRKRDLL